MDLDSASSALPTSDPVYPEIIGALDRRLSRGPDFDGLVEDLLTVVADDRVRQAGTDIDAELAAAAATMTTTQRLELGEDPDDDEPLGTVCVRSGVTALGVFTCEVTYTEDVTRILTPSEVGPYADTLGQAVVEAEYTAAVINQLRNKLHMAAPDVWQIAMELRESRPAINQKHVKPLIVRASVGQNTGLPYLTVRLAGTKLRWRWDPADALDHAQAVRDTVLVADLDAAYRRHLVSRIDVSDQVARSVVHDLANWRYPRGTAG